MITTPLTSMMAHLPLMCFSQALRSIQADSKRLEEAKNQKARKWAPLQTSLRRVEL